ncbi:chemotaxis protein CheW [Trichloromonas sp.]|uniref:chemotaxis protein CheW n=1 Tax=Trichloromonas sp. TaxID=3069249 RepID=UPI003D81AF9E
MAQLLVFRIGGEMYGLEVAHIQEVVESPQLYYIPRAPASLLGAMNFHGSILPVLDLAACLGFGEAERDPRVIVLTPGEAQLALAVTAMAGIVPFADEALLPGPEDQSQATCIRAVLPDRGEMINLLDLERLLGSLENL